MTLEQIWWQRKLQIELAVVGMLKKSVLPFLISICMGLFLWEIAKLYQFRKGKKIERCLEKILFFSYCTFLFCITFFLRKKQEGQAFDLIPFDTPGGLNLIIVYAIANIIIFVPLGFLYSSVVKKEKIKKGVVLGIVISTTIEVAQFLFKRGEGQTEDILLNVLGTVMGCVLYKLFKKVIRKNEIN